ADPDRDPRRHHPARARVRRQRQPARPTGRMDRARQLPDRTALMLRKPDTLRAAIVTRLPELARDAQALKVWVDKGRVAARASRGMMAWEYRYQLSILIIDFAQDPDLLFCAVLEWLAIEQPELLLNI